MKKNVVLTIAGSDCSGGAGVQADIAVIGAYGMYAESVITAVTAQNTLGVQALFPMSRECISSQLDSVFSDIVPDAVKIGMIPSKEAVEVIAEKLSQYGCGNSFRKNARYIPVVIDPVLISTSGHRLLPEDAQESLVQKLFPLATVITPNIPEDELFKSMEKSSSGTNSAVMYPPQASVLVKGGHANTNECTDVLYLPQNKIGIRESVLLSAARIANLNTHGTGCTLSSAIACEFAKNSSAALDESAFIERVRNAKKYCTKCIAARFALGKGRGPLWHYV